MKKSALLIKTTAFILFGLLLFFEVQRIVTPKRDPIIFPERANNLEENVVDVVFLGSSHVYNGISPMEIYARTGITAYDLTSNAQLLPHSYFFLKDFFERQSPKVVVVDALGLFFKPLGWEDAWQFLFDTMPIGKTKWDIVAAYREITGKSLADTVSCFFPIIDYHGRWQELTPIDFSGAPQGLSFSAGYLMGTSVWGNSFSADWINAAANEMENEYNQGWLISNDHGSIDTSEITEPIFDETVSEWNKEWLSRIQKLCEEHHAQCILSKVPNLIPPQDYVVETTWTYHKIAVSKSIAADLGIPYVDLGYGESASLDFTKDSMDGGKHLNVLGAEKVSAFWADYLMNETNLNQKERDSEQYNSMLQVYQPVKDVGMLQSETDVQSYLDRLIEHQDQWDVVICSLGEYTAGLTVEEKSGLSRLGCTLTEMPEFQKTHICYGAVLSNGQAVCEKISNRRIENSIVLDGANISFIVSNWHTGYFESVLVNGHEYTQGQPHLSFVIIDKETGLVIDSVDFDLAGEAANRTGENWNRLYDYEAAKCDIVSAETGYRLER